MCAHEPACIKSGFRRLHNGLKATRVTRPPERQPANSTAKEEETPPKSAPARKKALEVLGCAAQDERETYVTKAPKTISCVPGSHAKDPATRTDWT